MAVQHTCVIHPESDPRLDCEECENRFCADCAELLTNDNSMIGGDVCDDCSDRQEEDERP